MAYHHFYLIYDSITSPQIKDINIIKNKNNHKIFELSFPKSTYNGYGVNYKVYKFEYQT